MTHGSRGATESSKGKMASTAAEESASVDNFTNDSAMMIAWERHLETKRGAEALFSDPFAEALAGVKGEALSEGFGGMCKIFELEGWPEFHKTLVIHPRAAADLQRRPRGGFVAFSLKKRFEKDDSEQARAVWRVWPVVRRRTIHAVSVFAGVCAPR